MVVSRVREGLQSLLSHLRDESKTKDYKGFQRPHTLWFTGLLYRK